MTATIEGEGQVSTGSGPGQGNQFSGFLQNRREQARRAAQEADRKREMLADLGSIFQKYGLSRVYAFGSVTREFCRTDSDIDLYVEFVDAEKYWELWRELEEYTQERIDLHCQRDDPVFVRKIKERGWLIYEA